MKDNRCYTGGLVRDGDEKSALRDHLKYSAT